MHHLYRYSSVVYHTISHCLLIAFCILCVYCGAVCCYYNRKILNLIPNFINNTHYYHLFIVFIEYDRQLTFRIVALMAQISNAYVGAASFGFIRAILSYGVTARKEHDIHHCVRDREENQACTSCTIFKELCRR